MKSIYLKNLSTCRAFSYRFHERPVAIASSLSVKTDVQTIARYPYRLSRNFRSILAIFVCLASFAWPALGATKNACNLIASADAQTAIGEPIGLARGEDQPSPSGDGSSCEFRSTTGSAFKAKSVRLDVHYSNTDITGSAPGIAENLKAAGFKDVHTVTGLGATAIWASNSLLGRSQGELTVIQGKSVLLTVLITGVKDEADSLARAKVLAQKAIAKL